MSRLFMTSLMSFMFAEGVWELFELREVKDVFYFGKVL